MTSGDTLGAVVKAAREVVASHRGAGDLSTILDGLDRLDDALKANDAATSYQTQRAQEAACAGSSALLARPSRGAGE